MPTLNQLKQALIKADQAGDTESARRLAPLVEKYQDQYLGASSIPGNFSEDTEIPELTVKQPEPSVAETIGSELIGAGETALTLGTGATTGTLGMLGGTLKGLAEEMISGEFGTKEAASRIEQQAMEGMRALTYAPRTEAGQEQVEAIGDIASQLPIAPEIVGAASVARNVSSATPAIVRTQLLPTVKAATSKVSPAIKGATKRVTEVVMSPITNKRRLVEEIKAGERNIDNITVQLDQQGKLIKSPVYKQATKILGDTVEAKQTAILFESMNDATSSQVNKMLNHIVNGRKYGSDYIMRNRPSDVIGESIAKRAIAANKVKKSANDSLKAVIKSDLSNKNIDLSVPVDTFFKNLDDVGIKVARNENGRLVTDLTNATVRLGDVLPKSELDRLINQLDSRKINGATAHDMKRFIRDFVDYDTGLPSGVKTSSKVESALKELSSGINEKLSIESPRYAAANKKFASVADALNSVSKQLKGVDLESEMATSKLGALSKRIGSNLVSRDQIIKMVDDLDSALAENKIRPKDDISAQVAALGKIEDIFKLEKEQSPFGFQSRIEKAIPTSKLDAVTMAIDKLKSINEPDFNAKVSALRKMLEQPEKGKK